MLKIKLNSKELSLKLFVLSLIIFNLEKFCVSTAGEKTIEQFLDRMLHETIYDRRIRPNFGDKSKIIFVR